MPDLLLLAGTAGIVATSVLLVTALRLASPVSFVLGVFAVAWAVTIAQTMLLSVAGLWTRGWMLVAIGAGLAAALAAWHLTGRPGPPSFRPALDAARGALRDPVLALLAAANLVAGAYVAVLAVALPPIDVDVAGYHLPRIVMWIQQHAVAAIANAPGSNLDANPPGAEIAKGLTMLLAETDRYTALFQVLCLPVGALAVAGVARRIGLELRAALFGALLYATFPIVALQAPTALNDLAVATALVVACHFALGQPRAELALCAVAVGLAVSTKISGILGLPSVALLALVALPAGRRLRVVAAGAAGCLLGSWWYLYNLARTGAWDGHLGSDYGQVPSRAPDEIFLRLERYVLQTLDLGGVVGRDRWLFPIAACLLAAAALVARRSRRRAAGLAAAAGLVALAPWLVDWAHVVSVRAIARSWIELGRPGVIGDLPMHAEARPFPGETWFGPVFSIALVAALVVAWRTTRGRGWLVLVTALLLAPGLLYVVNASAFVYDGARGRFFVIAGALAATGLGVLVRARPLAWATATIAVLTLGLSFVHFHGRPLGIRLLEPIGEESLWGVPRWRAQEALVAEDAEGLESARVAHETLPQKTTVAIAAGTFWPMYAVMGQGPWRTIYFVRPGEAIPSDAEFVAVAPGVAVHPPALAWQQVPGVVTWSLYRRVGAGAAAADQ
jgi:hypothetical protein